jgi:hypothetical protein
MQFPEGLEDSPFTTELILVNIHYAILKENYRYLKAPKFCS